MDFVRQCYHKLCYFKYLSSIFSQNTMSSINTYMYRYLCLGLYMCWSGSFMFCYNPNADNLQLTFFINFSQNMQKISLSKCGKNYISPYFFYCSSQDNHVVGRRYPTVCFNLWIFFLLPFFYKDVDFIFVLMVFACILSSPK